MRVPGSVGVDQEGDLIEQKTLLFQTGQDCGLWSQASEFSIISFLTLDRILHTHTHTPEP